MTCLKPDEVEKTLHAMCHTMRILQLIFPLKVSFKRNFHVETFVIFVERVKACMAKPQRGTSGSLTKSNLINIVITRSL
jgi:hypothetical protein